MARRPPGSSVHGILQARILEWIASPFSRGPSRPRGHTQVSHIVGRFFTVWVTREAQLPVKWSLNFPQHETFTEDICFKSFLAIFSPLCPHYPGSPLLSSLRLCPPSFKVWLQDPCLWETLPDYPNPKYTLLLPLTMIAIFPLAIRHAPLHVINQKGKATHSRILAWRIPWTEEPSRLEHLGLQRTTHDWTTNTFTLLSVHSIPATALIALNAEPPILTIHPWVVGTIYSHYTDEETGAQRG